MQILAVKNKEIKINDRIPLIVEDEVSAEPIRFDIYKASTIESRTSLTFIVQYWRSSTDNGYDTISSSNISYDSDTDILSLTWLPSGGSTLNNGKTKIQVVGQLVSGTTYSVRWATKVCEVEVYENLAITQNNVPTSDYVITYLNGVNNGTDNNS